MEQKNDRVYEKRILHDYHEAFYKLFRIPLDYLPLSNSTFTICGMSHCNALCTKIMSSPEGAARCAMMTAKRVAEAKRTGKMVTDHCHAGFRDILIPVTVNGKYFGGLSVGQFVDSEPDEAEFRRIRERLHFIHFEPGELEEYFRRTKHFTASEVEGLVELVRIIAEYISESRLRIRFMESVGRTDPIKAAEQYIKRNFVKKLSVDEIARAVGMSKSHFMHKFADQTGMSPIAYLNNYRVCQAQEMLQQSSLSVFEAATACGFISISHFNRQFRKYLGTAPRESRRSAGAQREGE